MNTIYIYLERERDTEREKETETERDRETETETERERVRGREGGRATEGERGREIPLTALQEHIVFLQCIGMLSY